MRKIILFLGVLVSAGVFVYSLSQKQDDLSPVAVDNTKRSIKKEITKLKSSRRIEKSKESPALSRQEIEHYGLDLRPLNLDSESTFSNILLTPVIYSNELAGFKVSENSQDYYLDDFGFTDGDVITQIEGQSFSPLNDNLIEILKPYVNNETIFLTINRNNEQIQLEVDVK